MRKPKKPNLDDVRNSYKYGAATDGLAARTELAESSEALLSGLVQSVPSEPLTAREREVLSWFARGKSGPEIAIILDISVCTVRIHVRNIIRKMDASNILHAVAKAFQAQLW